MGRFKDMADKQAVLFNAKTEALKALQIISEAPSKHATRSDATDLHAMGYQDNEVGFFIVILQTHVVGRPAFKVYEGEERLAIELLKKLNVQELDDHHWIATTGCSWSIAKQRFVETACIGYKAVVFSTPNQLFVLAENPT